MSPITGILSVSVCTNQGSRPSQEDRYIVAENFKDNLSVFCVLDGTVGEFVVERVKSCLLRCLSESPSWLMLVENDMRSFHSDCINEKCISLLENALKETFSHCDNEILAECKKSSNNYSACTAVLCIKVNDILITGHVGDSRAALAHRESGYTWGEFITADHKPDLPIERARIEASSGSVVYLASRAYATAFIRGADFTARKNAGDQPMQLQYSRGFGGKDLKPYGLSSEPDVRISKITESDFGLVIATDGLWDSMTASQAANIIASCSERTDVASVLVEGVVNETADNITAIVVLLR